MSAAFLLIDFIVLIVLIVLAIAEWAIEAHHGSDTAYDRWVRSGRPKNRFGKDPFPKGRPGKKISTGRKVFRAVIWGLVIVFGGLIIIALIGEYHDNRRRYLKDQKLNRYSYDKYEETSYRLEQESPVLLDAAGVKVTLKGIYAEQNYVAEGTDDINVPLPEDDREQYYRGRFMRLGLHVENTSDETRMVSVNIVAVNGISRKNYLLCDDLIGAHKSVTVYPDLYSVRGGVIKDIWFGDPAVNDKDYHVLFQSEENVHVTTDLDYSFGEMIPPENSTCIYEQNDIRIYAVKYDEDGRYVSDARQIWIFNDSDTDYYAGYSDPKVDGDKPKDYFPQMYRSKIIPHTVLIDDYIYGGMELEQAQDYDMKALTASFDFECPSDPSKNFSTTYLRINSYQLPGDTLGSDPNTLGSDPDTLGSDPDTLGSDPDTLGSDPNLSP